MVLEFEMPLFCYDAEAAMVRGNGPFIARPAKDDTPDWPAWYVAGPDARLNVLSFPGKGGAVLTDRATAEAVAEKFNKQQPRVP